MEMTVLFGEGVGEKGEGALIRGAGAYSNKYGTYPFKNGRGECWVKLTILCLPEIFQPKHCGFEKKISTCSLIMNTSFDINRVTLSLKI